MLVAILISLLMWQSRSTRQEPGRKDLLVYCAAAVQPAVRQIAERYERETGSTISIQTGPSGALETQVRVSGKGDLYIPAAQTPYLDRLQQDGIVNEVLPLAKYRLVLAFHPRVDAGNVTLGNLLAGELRYALANEEAAAGRTARESIVPHGIWPQFQLGAKAILPTVTAVAQSVKQGVAVDCGIVWDTTARQFGLRTIDVPELAGAHAVVAVGILSCSSDPPAARAFAEYLAAFDKGQAVFQELGYTIQTAPDGLTN